jgi:hypothetical protein
MTMGNGADSHIPRRAVRPLAVIGVLILIGAIGWLFAANQNAHQQLAKETTPPVLTARSVGHWYGLPSGSSSGRIKVTSIIRGPINEGHGTFTATIELCAGSKGIPDVRSNYLFQAVDGMGVPGPAPVTTGLPTSDLIPADSCTQFQAAFPTSTSWNPTTLEGFFEPGDGYRWEPTSR